mgnify:CR=1 FL=1
MRLELRRTSGFVLLLALLGIWQISALWWVESPNWPPVTAIVVAFFNGLASGEILQVFGSSMWRMLVGYLAGAIVGVSIGLLMARQRWIDAALTPLIELLRPIPMPAIIPPLILLLGIDHTMKIFAVAFATFFPVLVNTAGGIRSVDRTLLDVARTFQQGGSRTVFRVILPAAMPYIFAGLRTSLALALIVTVVAEMIAGSEGIGYYVITMQYAMRAADMYAAIFALAAVGYTLNFITLQVERRVLHWYQRS